MTSSQTPTASSPKDPQTAVTKYVKKIIGCRCNVCLIVCFFLILCLCDRNQTKGSEEKVLRFSFSPPPQGSRQPTEDYEVPRKQGEIPSSGSKV